MSWRQALSEIQIDMEARRHDCAKYVAQTLQQALEGRALGSAPPVWITAMQTDRLLRVQATSRDSRLQVWVCEVPWGAFVSGPQLIDSLVRDFNTRAAGGSFKLSW